MTNRPLVSIVTASFNQARYLEAALDSVAAQDFPSVEHIVIDGGSTDGSVEIIERHAARLAFWVSEPDRGQSHAINKGFGRGQGEILAWLNADDVLLPSAVSVAAHYLSADQGLGTVYGDRVEIDAKGNVVGMLRCPPHDTAMFRHDVTLPQETVFFRREHFEAVGGLDEALHFAMDLDLWCKLARRAPMRHVPAFLGCFRRHEEAKSVRYEVAESGARGGFHAEREMVHRRHFGRALPGAFERRAYHLRRWVRTLLATRTSAYRSDVELIRRIRTGEA